jgi:hypothetical protein
MKWYRIDSFWKGFIIGLFFPIIIFIFYWLLTDHQISFPKRYVKYLINGGLLNNVIKICGIGNLLLFWLGLNKKLDGFNKGIIVSVLLYVALVGYVMYFVEPEIY